MAQILKCSLFLFPLMIAAFPALAAQPASIEDCESIANSLAYNQCLASFGPKQGERKGERKVRSYARSEDELKPVARKTRSASGRKKAVFDIVTEEDDIPLSAPDPDQDNPE
jgi:hypothetical protein